MYGDIPFPGYETWRVNLLENSEFVKLIIFGQNFKIKIPSFFRGGRWVDGLSL